MFKIEEVWGSPRASWVMLPERPVPRKPLIVLDALRRELTHVVRANGPIYVRLGSKYHGVRKEGISVYNFHRTSCQRGLGIGMHLDHLPSTARVHERLFRQSTLYRTSPQMADKSGLCPGCRGFRWERKL